MRIPHVEQLVGAWEAGAGLPQTDRALELLAAAEPDLSRAALAALPIGERDRRLLQLRRELFGPRLDAIAMCPGCETRVEFEIALATVLLPASAAADSATLEINAERWQVRAATSADLLTIGEMPLDAAEAALFDRCATKVDVRESVPAPVDDEAVRAAAAKILELDPQADIQLSVACPSCQHTWLADFDVVSFLWAELTSWVRRLLVDVHRLASAYGWGEAEILMMSSQRRAAYLELIGA